MFLANQTTSDDLFSFEAEWFSSFRYDFNSTGTRVYGEKQNITCDLWSSILSVDVQYQNGIPLHKTRVTPTYILPARVLKDGGLFNPNATHVADGTTYSGNGIEFPGIKGTTSKELVDEVNRLSSLYKSVFRTSSQDFVWEDDRAFVPILHNVTTTLAMSNMRAIHDAVSQALMGTGSYLWASVMDEIKLRAQEASADQQRASGDYPNKTIQEVLATRGDNLPASLILGSSMATLDPVDFTAVNLTITAETLNSLLQNATISLLSTPNTNRTILVTKMDDRNAYIFDSPANLVVPYGVSLLLSTVFVFIGMRSLHANGSAASVGGILQVLRSTQGSSTLHAVASQAARRDASHEDRKALKNLKVRLGDLASTHGVADTTGNTESMIVGFGTESELSPVRK